MSGTSRLWWSVGGCVAATAGVVLFLNKPAPRSAAASTASISRTGPGLRVERVAPKAPPREKVAQAEPPASDAAPAESAPPAEDASATGGEAEFTFTTEMLDQMDALPGELTFLPPVPENPANPLTPEKVELGKLLYFDPRLSRDESMSCATCHHPNHGWGDGKARAVGFNGQILGRHSPTVLNAAYNAPQFWDGRAKDLEEQAAGPIMAAGEMNMGSEEAVIERISAVPEYARMFQAVFNGPPTLERIAWAIAAFEKTIVTPDAPFDRYARGDKSALTDEAKRGLILFFGKAECAQCHSGPNFTDNKFHNLGVHTPDRAEPDPGRFAVTQDEKDRGAFKTPSVRNAELTAPFMHDGSVATLEDLVEFYNRGGGEGANKSELLHALGLTDAEKSDLLAFIRSLTGVQPSVPTPALPGLGAAGQ